MCLLVAACQMPAGRKGVEACDLLLRASDGAEGCCKVTWRSCPQGFLPCRSNAADFAGGRGADAPVVQLDDAAAGEKLRVSRAQAEGSRCPEHLHGHESLKLGDVTGATVAGITGTGCPSGGDLPACMLPDTAGSQRYQQMASLRQFL